MAFIDQPEVGSPLPVLHTPLRSLEASSTTYVFYGMSKAGTASSAASWQIARVTKADNSVHYAGSTAGVYGKFDCIWDNRTALNYG